jgi:hypothetical protein
MRIVGRGVQPNSFFWRASLLKLQIPPKSVLEQELSPSAHGTPKCLGSNTNASRSQSICLPMNDLRYLMYVCEPTHRGHIIHDVKIRDPAMSPAIQCKRCCVGTRNSNADYQKDGWVGICSRRRVSPTPNSKPKQTYRTAQRGGRCQSKKQNMEVIHLCINQRPAEAIPFLDQLEPVVLDGLGLGKRLRLTAKIATSLSACERVSVGV